VFLGIAVEPATADGGLCRKGGAGQRNQIMVETRGKAAHVGTGFFRPASPPVTAVRRLLPEFSVVRPPRMAGLIVLRAHIAGGDGDEKSFPGTFGSGLGRKTVRFSFAPTWGAFSPPEKTWPRFRPGNRPSGAPCNNRASVGRPAKPQNPRGEGPLRSFAGCRGGRLGGTEAAFSKKPRFVCDGNSHAGPPVWPTLDTLGRSAAGACTPPQEGSCQLVETGWPASRLW